MRVALGTALALGLFAQGCSDEHGPVSPPCNITKKECQKAIFRGTAEVRGQDDAKMPPIRLISRDTYKKALEAWLADQDPDPKADAIEAGYALLGVLPKNMGGADQAYIDDLVRGVQAFYSPGAKDVTIINDVEDEVDATFVLSHEFVHALQHQRGDLTSPASAGSTDGSVAFASLIEGEAVFLSNVYMARLADVDVASADMEKYFDKMSSNMLAEIAKSDAPLYLAGEVLPYPLGGRGVYHAYESMDLAGIEALHAHEPATVAFWLADEEPPAANLRCDLPTAPAGFTVLERDRLGVVGLVALDSVLEATPSLDLSQAWRDDRVAVYASADLGEVALAYRVRFATADAASQLETALAAHDTKLQLRLDGDELLVVAPNGQELDLEGCPALAAPVVMESEALVRSARRRVPFMR
jgi:hypothetical protein